MVGEGGRGENGVGYTLCICDPQLSLPGVSRERRASKCRQSVFERGWVEPARSQEGGINIAQGTMFTADEAPSILTGRGFPCLLQLTPWRILGAR